MKLGVEGKRALVTGSGSGIGEGVARALAAEGVRLVVNGSDKNEVDRTVAAIIGDGGCAESVVGDLSTPESAAGVIASVLANGGIDILIHNACEPVAALPDWFSIPDEDWEKSFSVNVMSAVRAIRALVPIMRRRGWGRIINVSSAGVAIPVAAVADYQASAAALINLTVNLARSLAGTGITANVISAGPALVSKLGILSVSPQSYPVERPAAPLSPYRARDPGKATAMGWDRTREISAAAALLVSKSSDFTTGTTLHVGAGWAEDFAPVGK